MKANFVLSEVNFTERNMETSIIFKTPKKVDL